MNKLDEIHSREELIKLLKERKIQLSKFFEKRIDTLEEIVCKCVEGNTVRAFKHMRKPPSEVFRRWAVTQLKNEDTLDKIKKISSEKEYDDWLKGFSENFFLYWKTEMGKDIPYGPGRKLPNLLMKTFVLWSQLEDNLRIKLINFLHVPLDSFALGILRNCTSDLGVRIPKNATMSFVKDEITYNRLQNIIKDIAKKADVPPIYLDVLAWDEQHKPIKLHKNNKCLNFLKSIVEKIN